MYAQIADAKAVKCCEPDQNCSQSIAISSTRCSVPVFAVCAEKM